MKTLSKIIITTAAVSCALTATAFAADLTTKSIEVATGTEIYMNGEKLIPTDTSGNEVETLLYNGTTYLPVRALSEALGNTVEWDSENSRVNVTSSTEISDRQALKELVDTFSILADDKDSAGQVELFTDDAKVMSYRNGELTSELTGKQEIETAFANFLARYDTVYHINGQQVVEINGDEAHGTAYCYVVMTQDSGDTPTITTQGVRYSDTYKKVDGKWLITDRTSNFMWSDTKAMN